MSTWKRAWHLGYAHALEDEHGNVILPPKDAEMRFSYLIFNLGFGWITGCYATEDAAKLAFELPDEVLYRLQHEVNEREPEYRDRVITLEMLEAAQR